MTKLALPPFVMDCRDWLAHAPAQLGLADTVDDVPLVTVLSSACIADDIYEVRGVITLGLMDELPFMTRRIGAVAAELLDCDDAPGVLRFVLPAPNGEFALLAQFCVPSMCRDALTARVEALMASFHWAEAA